METVVSDMEPEKTSHHCEVKDPQGPAYVITNSDDSPVTHLAKMSQRQGKDAYLSPTKDLVQATLSPGIINTHALRVEICVIITVLTAIVRGPCYFHEKRGKLNGPPYIGLAAAIILLLTLPMIQWIFQPDLDTQ